MNEELEREWTELLETYPPVVRQVMRAAMEKAHDVRQQARQTDIRDEILERLDSLLRPDNVLDPAVVDSIMEWTSESEEA